MLLKWITIFKLILGRRNFWKSRKNTSKIYSADNTRSRKFNKKRRKIKQNSRKIRLRRKPLTIAEGMKKLKNGKRQKHRSVFQLNSYSEILLVII